MNSVDLSIEKINEKELMGLIEKGEVDLAILKSSGLATIDNLNFLFLLDKITISELASYRSLNRTTVYRQVMRNLGTAIERTRDIYVTCRTITVSPKNVFENIYDYEDFLKWRSDERSGKRSISITNTMLITGLTRRQILMLIKKDKLVAIKKKNGAFEVLESSLELFLIGYLVSEKQKMEKAVEFLNSKGNRASIKLQLSEICI